MLVKGRTLSASRRKVVNDVDLIPPIQISLGKIRTDKTRSSGNENFQ
jgi:hypothetical protein